MNGPNTLKRKPWNNKPGFGSFGSRLKAERIRRNWGLLQFATELGVDESRVSAWENRGEMPRIAHLIAIAVVLECTTDYLCGLEEE